jgi:hypothetical protein
MCVEAFQELHRSTEGRNFEYIEYGKVGTGEFHRVHFKNGRPKDLFAFTCPINPLVYLSVADEQTVWIFVREAELRIPRLNIIDYEWKIVDSIFEGTYYRMYLTRGTWSVTNCGFFVVNMRNLRGIPPTDVLNSSIGPDELTKEACRQLCDKALRTASEMDVTFAPEKEVGPSKFYALKTQSRNLIVQAFKCPTNPDVYLHINSGDASGMVVWICTARETDVAFRVPKIVGYRTQFVQEIIEGTKI